MNQRLNVFGFGVRLGAGFTVGSFLGLGIMAAAGYLVMKLSPDKKSEEKEEVKDAGDSESTGNE